MCVAKYPYPVGNYVIWCYNLLSEVTEIILSAQNDHKDIAKMLIPHGAYVNHQNELRFIITMSNATPLVHV